MMCKLIRFLCLSLVVVPGINMAQPMVVLGGGQKAQECFMNAEMAAQNLPGVGRTLLEPCTYTLEYSTINMQDRAATLANRGIVYAALNNYDAAMADYNAAIKIRPSAPEFYINRGNSFFMIREFASAMEDYELSLELGLKQAHFAHYNMGMVYERLGNDSAAEAAYAQAVAIQPDWVMANDKLAMIRQRLAEDAASAAQQ